jgi:benzaldehyde dehydrogenase (NAD)
MFLDESTWKGQVFLGGAWTAGGAGAIDVTEPATGSVLGRIGLADAHDLAKAAENAAEAQRAVE